MANETFEQGWAARPFAEQFPELPKEASDRLDRLNAAVTDLYLADMLTQSEVDRARKKFGRVVGRELAKAIAVQQGGES